MFIMLSSPLSFKIEKEVKAMIEDIEEIRDHDREGGHLLVTIARTIFSDSYEYLMNKREKLEREERLSMEECRIVGQIMESVTNLLQSIRSNSLDDPQGDRKLAVITGFLVDQIDAFLREMEAKTSFGGEAMSPLEFDLVSEITHCFNKVTPQNQ